MDNFEMVILKTLQFWNTENLSKLKFSYSKPGQYGNFGSNFQTKSQSFYGYSSTRFQAKLYISTDFDSQMIK